MSGAPDPLSRLVRGFRGKPIAVLADLVADEFLHGEIERVSREAPVLVLRESQSEIVAGGGGNAVLNLRALGARPLPVGVVGRDAAGDRLLAEFRRRRIPTDGIVRQPGYQTPTKTRIVAGGVHTRRQQVVRIDRGASPGTFVDRLTRRLASRLAKALRGTDALLVSDYGYGAATPRLVRGATRGRRGLVVTVDSRARVADYRDVTACTPNQEELERAFGMQPLTHAADVARWGRKLAKRCRADAVLVTRGPNGVALVEGRRPARHIPAFGSDEVADVTGAGDTVTAVFSLSLLAGASFGQAAQLANCAAGLVVMKAGTATLTARELIGALEESER